MPSTATADAVAGMTGRPAAEDDFQRQKSVCRLTSHWTQEIDVSVIRIAVSGNPQLAHPMVTFSRPQTVTICSLNRPKRVNALAALACIKPLTPSLTQPPPIY